MAGPLIDGVKKAWAGMLGRMQVNRGQRRLALVETLNLGGKRQLILVACDGQNYLIGAGGDSVHSIEPVRPVVKGQVLEDDLMRPELMGIKPERLH